MPWVSPRGSVPLPAEVSRTARRVAVLWQSTPSEGWRRMRRLLGAALLGGLLNGCTLLLELDRSQCESDADCAARGGAFENSVCIDAICRAPDGAGEALACANRDDCAPGVECIEDRCVGQADPAFACLDEPPVVVRDERVEVVVPVMSVLGGALPDQPVRVCRSVDAACSNPVVETMSDSDGLVALDLPADFTGYLALVSEGYYPVYYFLPMPLLSGATLTPAWVSPPEIIAQWMAIVGAPSVADRGHVLVFVTGCDGKPAPGVKIEAAKADNETVPFYTMAVPTTDLHETVQDGSGGFANFPAGDAVMDFVLSRTGQALGRATIFVAAGAVSQAQFQVAAGRSQ